MPRSTGSSVFAFSFSLWAGSVAKAVIFAVSKPCFWQSFARWAGSPRFSGYGTLQLSLKQALAKRRSSALSAKPMVARKAASVFTGKAGFM